LLIPDPNDDFIPSRIPDPGVKKAHNHGSRIRIRNTAMTKFTFTDKVSDQEYTVRST